MSERGRICLHAPYLYPLFSGGRVPFAGGAETQQAALARGLARMGYDVSVVTCDYGQPREVVVDGVTLIRSYPPQAGLPVVRFVHPRLTRSISGLRRAAADVYYVRGAGLTAGVTFDVARAMGAGFVFAAAHDHDTGPDSPLLPNPRDRWWYRRAVRGADRVLAQTRWQQQAFRDRFARESDWIPNLVNIPDAPVDAGAGETVLWLSTYKAAKRPEWFIELARRFPQHRFVMCGVVPPPPLTRDAWDAARLAAEACPNLEVRGHVPHEELPELYSNVGLFVHTSPAEGFANTLLEAWSFGVPTLVCTDPDDLVATHGLGSVADDLDSLASELERWMTAPNERRAAGQRARDYVKQHHAPQVVLNDLSRVLDAVIREVRQRQ